jgi:hypothetical protein
MTSKTEQEAIAEFIRLKGVTRCPTVCAGPTQAKPAPTDLVELQKHVAAQEAARLAKYPSHRHASR